MRFAVDPWDPTYGTSLDGELGESSAGTDPAVELAPDRWRPIDAPPGLRPPDRVLFVDGVRRVDAQVWIEAPRSAGGAPSAALCASYAAGMVCCCRDEGAHLLVADVRRGLFTTAAGAADVVTWAGTYGLHRAPQRPDLAAAQVLSLALQRELADAEVLVAAGAERDAGDLLVVDGPLRGRQHLPRALGFVKSHRSEYLPSPLGAVVAALGAGQRTPVFGVGTALSGAMFRRHSWYLRLPCAPGSPWAGIVRVECSAELDPDAAVTLAALSQVTLGRFASAQYKDSRAPQNLYPIAGLERALRRRLGEPGVLYRALRRAAAGEAHHGQPPPASSTRSGSARAV